MPMRISKPLFSIVTVVQNDRAGLEKTAASVFCQLFNNIEWIVIDGASTDDTITFLTESEMKPDIWISEPDQGIYDAMNKGVALSSGLFTVFMNAGDVFAEDDSLDRVAGIIKKAGHINFVVYGGAILEFPNGKTWYRQPRISEQYIWHGLPANHQATYYPTAWLSQNKYVLDYKFCGDYYIAAKAHMSPMFSLYINTPIVRFRMGDASYKHPNQLVIEAYRIQRDILGISFWKRILSLIRRTIATSVCIVIYNFPISTQIHSLRNGGSRTK